jgi:cytochrome P450
MLGSMAGLLQTLRALFGNRIRMLEELGASIPGIGRATFGRIGIVLVNTPDLIPEVLIERADDYQKGAFAHHRVARYAAVMAGHASSAQAHWRHGERIDIAQAMMRLALGIVGKTLFDVDLLDRADTLGGDITTVQKSAVRQMRLGIRLPMQEKALRALARLNETIFRLIHDRRAQGIDKGDLLSMLLLSQDEETGRHLTDEQVRDEAMTLFLAGHETTAQAMAWSWYLLAGRPKYFERLRREGMPFALQVMKESMRLYPPAFLLARSALRDTAIGGFPVRKDEIVFIAPWLLHRDPRLFEDPLRFDPDRFLPEREARIPRFAYLPFGGGKRICIGNQFALMEGQIILSTIAQGVSMELVSQRPIDVEPLLTLRPKGGVMVNIRRLRNPAA